MGVTVYIVHVRVHVHIHIHIHVYTHMYMYVTVESFHRGCGLLKPSIAPCLRPPPKTPRYMIVCMCTCVLAVSAVYVYVCSRACTVSSIRLLLSLLHFLLNFSAFSFPPASFLMLLILWAHVWQGTPYFHPSLPPSSLLPQYYNMSCTHNIHVYRCAPHVLSLLLLSLPSFPSPSPSSPLPPPPLALLSSHSPPLFSLPLCPRVSSHYSARGVAMAYIV